jgi:tryprostatin B 6-hydroxylase
MLAPIQAVPWAKTLYRILPVNKQVKSEGLVFAKTTFDRFEERYKRGTDRDDLTTYLLLPDPKTNISMTKKEVGQESIIVVVAGSDTSSICLTYLLYYILQDREKYLKLQAEVDSLWDGHGEIDGQKLTPSQAPYINGAINESLRMDPPDPNGNQRSTPKGGHIVDGTFIPEHTQVSVHKWSIQRDERNFSRPLEFIPERWISEGERERLKIQNHDPKAFMPFGVGQYACVGKPLALLEMRLFLLIVLRRLDFKLAPSFNKTAFEDGVKSYLTLLKGSIPVTVKERPL